MKNDTNINPSTAKSRRRNLALDAVAKMLTGDPTATWSSIGTSFTSRIFPANVDPSTLTNKNIKAQIKEVLAEFGETLDSMPNTGAAKDFITVLEEAPRKKRGKK